MRLTVIILMVCCYVNVSGQQRTITVSGYVRDANTGEVLPGTTVAGSVHHSIANQSGFYSLTLNAAGIIRCSLWGYEPVELPVQSDTVINFMLVPQEITLDQVVVNANRKGVETRTLGNVGIQMNQLRYQPLFLGERDVIKFMQLLPGISSGREGSSQLNVRGGSGDQTLLMLDNVPIYNQNHAFGVVSIFNGDALSGVELYKGYIPAAYGGRLSSVASIMMRDGDKYAHHQSLTVGTLTLGLLLEGPLKKGIGSYLVSARQFTPGLLLPVYWKVRGSDLRINYSFHDVTVKLNYALGKKNTLFGSFYTGRDYFTIDDSDRSVDQASGQKSLLSDNGAGYDWGNISGSLRLNTILGSKAFMNNSVYFSRLSNHQGSYFKDYETGGSMNSDMTSALYELGIRSVVEQNIGTSHKVNYGLNASSQTFMPQTTSYTRNGETTRHRFAKQELYSIALFAEDQVTKGFFTLNAGARLSVYDNTENAIVAFEPRLGLSVELGKNNAAWMSFTNSTQPVFSATKMNNGLPFDFWLPFPQDRIEKAWQASVGWKTTSLKNITLTVEGFYKRMRNLSLIYAVDDYLAGELDLQPAEGYAYGAELLLQYELPRFSMMGTYTFSRSMRRADGVTFPYQYDSPHDLNLFATYTTLEKRDRKHTLSINIGYRTGFPYSISVDSYPGIAPPFPFTPQEEDIYNTPRHPNTRMPDYFRSDMSFTMERRKRNGKRTWQLSVLNMTNHYNPIMIYPSDQSPTGFRAVNLIPVMPSFSYKRTF